MNKISKNNQIVSRILVVLMFAMTLFSSYGYVYGNSENKDAAAASNAAKIYFETKDGKKIYPDENNTFTLSSRDKGQFKVEDIEKYGVDEAYFEGAVPMKDGTRNWTNVWVYSNGTYQGYDKRTVDVEVYTKSSIWPDAVKLGDFKIKGTGANATGLKVFSNGKEISMDNPVYIAGSSGADISFKAQFGEGEEYVDIPNSDVELNAVDNGYTYMSQSVSIIKNTKPATFEAHLHDNSASVKFKAEPTTVKLESFEIKYPKVVYIDQYNGLGEKWIGSTQGNHEGAHQITFVPENAGNQNLDWKALNPEVAEYEHLHGNGIVPKKAGKAKFIVTSEENPKLQQEVELEFKYRHPLEKMEMEQTEFKLKPYEMVNLQLTPTPSDATEQRYIWSYSEDGIVKVSSKVSRSGVHEPHVFGHMLTAKKPGTVTVTGTPLDDTAGANKIQFTVTVEGEQKTEKLDYLSMAKKGVNDGIKVLEKSGINSYTNEWNIFTIQRAGGNIGSENAKAYMDSAAETLKNTEGMSVTDYARIALAVGALGGDATNIGGTNLIDMISGYSNMRSSTSNAPIFSLIAINSKNYKVKLSKIWDREMLTSQILKFQREDGSFSLNKDDKTGSVDMTAMALQSLAPAYKKGGDKDVNLAVGKALDYLADQMGDDCTYSDNSPSTAQVLTALTSLGIDPTTADKFTRGSKNLITSLLEFKNGAGYGISKADKVNNPFADTQVTYALDSYVRFAEGRPALYDFSDAKAPEENAAKPDPGFSDFLFKCYSLVRKQVPKEIKFIEDYRVQFEKFKENPANDQKAIATIERYLTSAESRVRVYNYAKELLLTDDEAAKKILDDAYYDINSYIKKNEGKADLVEFDKLVDEAKAKLDELVDGDVDTGDDNGELSGEILEFAVEGYDILDKQIPEEIDYIKNFRAKYDGYRAMKLDPSSVEDLDGIAPLLEMAEGKVALYESVNHDELSDDAKTAVDALLKEGYEKINNIDDNLNAEETKAEVDKIVAEYKAKLAEAAKGNQPGQDGNDNHPGGDDHDNTRISEISSENHQIKATGDFEEGTTLVVDEITDENHSAEGISNELYTEIKKQLDDKANDYSKVYEVKLNGKKISEEIELKFNVGEGYEGRDAQVLHYVNGSAVPEIKGTTVKGGAVTVKVKSLSPFVVRILKAGTTTGDQENPGTETPGTTTDGQENPGTETPGTTTDGQENQGTETPGPTTVDQENQGTEHPGAGEDQNDEDYHEGPGGDEHIDDYSQGPADERTTPETEHPGADGEHLTPYDEQPGSDESGLTPATEEPRIDGHQLAQNTGASRGNIPANNSSDVNKASKNKSNNATKNETAPLTGDDARLMVILVWTLISVAVLCAVLKRRTAVK